MIGYLISIGNFSDINNSSVIKKINLTSFDPLPQSTLFKKPEKNCFHPRRKSRSPSPRRRSSPVRRERKRSHSRSPRHRTKSRSPSPAPEKKEKTPELPEPSVKVKEPSVQEATSTRQVHNKCLQF